MTHPDTLTIPRAVVEQALEALYLSYALLEIAKSYHYPKVLDAYKTLRAALQPQAAEPTKGDDELCFDDSEHLAAQAASDCRTCQHLSEAWGVCEARPKCVGGEQYVYFPEKQLWDKTPRNDGQAAHQEMREALYAEFNSAGVLKYMTTPPATQAEPVTGNETWLVVKEHVWEHDDGGRPTLAYLLPSEFGRVTYPSFDAASSFIKAGNWPIGWVAMKLDTPPSTQAALTAALKALKNERDLYVLHDADGAPEYLIDAIAQIEALKGAKS